MKITNFDERPADQVKSWTELMVQLVRIVSKHNNWDPAKVPDN